jgi:hypothetical protein
MPGSAEPGDATPGTKVVRTVQATGDRSIAIGGDAINSLLVTGDNNTFFIGQYERLQDAYLNPRALHQELGLDRFTGRDWLVAAVDRFLSRYDRGYLVLEAEAGMGKSTFLAWIARERGYVSHFVRLMPDPDDVGVAMRNLTAQLIRAWDLDTYTAGGILPPAANRPEFFQQVLHDAADRRDRLGTHEPIVVVVDGLNETAPVAGSNPLGLPATLPAGVYVIVSQRTVQVPLRLEVPREVIRIEADSPENQRDADAFLRARAASEPIQSVLRRDGVDPSDFVETLLIKSQGVWIYLHYVLADIAQGRIRAQQVDDLPIGLWHYYAQYWHQWQLSHQDRWYEVDLPLLSVLAAAAEPVPAATLATLAGLGTRHLALVEELLDDAWRPFLQVDETGAAPLYRTFHNSLREFLSGHAAVDALTSAERSLARRLAEATTAAHARIADRYLEAWGGLREGLPALAAADGDSVTLDGGYGLRHVVDHLTGAGRLDDLHALMTLSSAEGEGGHAANLWFAVHRRTGEIGAYRRDLAAAWNAARRLAGPLRCATQLRYALIGASLNSMVEATPPALWSLLVGLGRLTAREALSQAREIPTAEDRAEALTSLIGVVPAEAREEVEREAMAAVRAVPDEFWRVGELLRLHDQVAAERRDDLLPIVRSLVNPYFQVVAYRLLGVTVAPPAAFTPLPGRGHELDLESPSGIMAFESFIEDYRRRRELAASRLGSAGFSAEPPAGGAPAPPSSDPSERYWTAHLRTVAALNAADPEEVRRLTQAALEAGERIGHRPEATTAWLALGAALAATPATRAWAAEQLLTQIADLPHRIAVLVSLAAADAPDAAELGGIAEQVAAAGDDRARATLLRELAPALARCGAASAERLTVVLGDPVARARVLLAVSEHAPPPDAGRLAAATVATVAAEPGLAGRAGLLGRAAPYLPAAAVGQALSLTDAWPGDEVRASVRAALAVRLCELDEIAAAGDVLASVQGLRHAEALPALATAHLRRGDRRAALALVPAIPHPLWQAEILALAAHDTDAEEADAAIAAAEAAGAELDPPSRVSALARAAQAAPARYQAALCAALLATARAIEDQHQRSVALSTAAGALLASADVDGAVAVCREATVDELRADALARVAAALPPLATVQRVADQAASLRDRPARARVELAALAATLAITSGPATAPTAGEAATAPAALFDAALRDLASGPRDRLLASLPTLLQAVRRLDGPDAVRTVAEDLAAIERWWP